jgi:Tfp pilus tip-associated adhesin PilY1
MKRKLKSCLAFLLCTGMILRPVLAAADDIDIFTGTSGGTSTNPRILIVLDNTSNWARQSQQWPGGLQQGQSEARAIQNLLPTLDSSVSMGLMEFVTGGNANDTGGFIRAAVAPLDATAKTSFASKLGTIYNNVTSPNEKHNANTPYGDLMYDAYQYFAGGNAYSPSAVVASLADSNGYTTNYSTFKSPLDATNTCGKSFVIFIGNPNSSGPASDSADNTARLNSLNGSTVKQLGLPNFSEQNTTTRTNVGTTSACYASATAAAAEIPNFSSQCSTYTEDCAIGDPTAHVGPVACPAGTQAYTVIQSIYHPATSSPGSPVVGTPYTPQNGTTTTTGYYATSTSFDPNNDHGTLTCPPATTTTDNSTGNTATTTYSCAYSVGAPVGTATQTTNNGTSNSCYAGVGTGSGKWDPSTTTDFGSLTCPANSSCTYNGVWANNASGCTGNNSRRVSITETITAKRKYNVTQTITPTTVNTTNTAAYTSTAALGKTSQCYASAPSASTGDYSSSCTGTNISCTYGNAPTAASVDSCPAGTSAYKIDGINIELVDTPTGTTTTDTGPRNADEWARLMHDKGIPVAGATVNPSVTTYTIDVYNKQPNATQTALLMSMAKAGGGKYFAAKNEQAILDALKQIIVEIQAVNTTFASTSLPVNATNRAQNENQVFIGMFRPDPDAKPRWFGNLKRYQLVASGAGVDLGDSNGKLALNPLTGFITPCATSYWTTDSGTYWSGLGINPDPASGCTTSVNDKYSDSPDGPQVEKGGAAEVVRIGNTTGAATNAVNRHVLTLLSNNTLGDFTTASSSLSDSLVRFIRGEDTNNEKNSTDPASLTTTRPSIHGDVIHSRPLPVNYGGSTGVRVFYGANDGALHAVSANTGVENWSFVAPEFFSRLSRLKDDLPLVSYPNMATGLTPTPTPKDYFYDGSTGLYQNADNSKVWIYTSMRRGGRRIYAFDVTHPDSPVYKWRAGCGDLTSNTDCTSGMTGIGQTWSTPSVALISGYSTTTPVVAFGGGYDSCEDADTASPNCSSGKGNAIYILDGSDGTVLASFTTDRAVAADVAMVDINNDGSPDYLYAVDTGGNIYRVDFVSPITHLPLAKIGWTMRKVAYTNGGGRKFLFAPALLSAGSKIYLALGSGDREHPLRTQYPYANVTNRFYVYRDDPDALATTPAYDLDSMDDFTSQDSCSTPPVLPTSTKKGWFMNLNQYGRGEQVVTSALIASGMVTFSTNRPIPPDAASCTTALGEARGYWVNLLNGSGAINGGTCGGQRSSTFVGGGLPPSPVMANSVPIGDKAVSVIIGAVQKDDTGAGSSSAIGPQKHRPQIQSRRKRTYTYTSGG